MAQQIMDINNSPLFTELTAEEAANVNGGNIFTTPFVNDFIATTNANAAALGTGSLIVNPSAQAGYAGIMNGIGAATLYPAAPWAQAVTPGAINWADNAVAGVLGTLGMVGI